MSYIGLKFGLQFTHLIDELKECFVVQSCLDLSGLTLVQDLEQMLSPCEYFIYQMMTQNLTIMLSVKYFDFLSFIAFISTIVSHIQEIQ